MAVTGRAGLIALALTAVVLVASAPAAVLAVVDGALLLAILADVLLAPSPRQLTIRRELPSSGRLGEASTAQLIVANDGPRRVRARIRDAWPPSAGLSPPTVDTRIPAGERRLFAQQLVPTRRGDRAPVVVTIRSFGPLGLGARQRGVTVGGRIRVQPAFPSRKLLPEKLSRLRVIEGMVAARGPGRGTEFDSLREYVRGDDVRAIDWRASARRATASSGNTLQVRQYRPERDRRLIVALDTGRTSAARVGDAPRLDAALDAALLLAAVALKAGDRVDMIAADAVPRALLQRASLATLSQAMSGLEPALLEADASRIVGQLLRIARRRCLVVLFTDLTAATVEEGLLPALEPLLRRHEVLVGAVADPLVAELVAARGSADAVYSAAAAERASAERRRLAALLRRRGVEVVDVPPDHFASAVTDRYLALKAAGLL
jgi:uncharacterized protein (DUF58 family)